MSYKLNQRISEETIVSYRNKKQDFGKFDKMKTMWKEIQNKSYFKDTPETNSSYKQKTIKIFYISQMPFSLIIFQKWPKSRDISKSVSMSSFSYHHIWRLDVSGSFRIKRNLYCNLDYGSQVPHDSNCYYYLLFSAIWNIIRKCRSETLPSSIDILIISHSKVSS